MKKEISAFKKGQKVDVVGGSNKGKTGYVLGSDLNPHIDKKIGWVMQATLVDENGEFVCFAWEMNLQAVEEKQLPKMSKGQQALYEKLLEKKVLTWSGDKYDSRFSNALVKKGLAKEEFKPSEKSLNDYELTLA